MIFGSGTDSEFATSIPHIKKEIRQHVDDKTRSENLLDLAKTYEKSVKSYEKERKKLRKKLNKAGKDRSVGTEEFLQFYKDYYWARADAISQLTLIRLQFQEQLPMKSWNR